MMQLDNKGRWHPTKVFPCECGSEGLTVTVVKDDNLCEGAPFIDIAFWEFSSKFNGSKLTIWDRIKYAIHILRGKSPWADMVEMRSSTAKNFANHILYLISKSSERGDTLKPLVDWPKNGYTQ